MIGVAGASGVLWSMNPVIVSSASLDSISPDTKFHHIAGHYWRNTARIHTVGELFCCEFVCSFPPNSRRNICIVVNRLIHCVVGISFPAANSPCGWAFAPRGGNWKSTNKKANGTGSHEKTLPFDGKDKRGIKISVVSFFLCVRLGESRKSTDHSPKK